MLGIIINHTNAFLHWSYFQIVLIHVWALVYMCVCTHKLVGEWIKASTSCSTFSDGTVQFWHLVNRSHCLRRAFLELIVSEIVKICQCHHFWMGQSPQGDFLSQFEIAIVIWVLWKVKPQASPSNCTHRWLFHLKNNQKSWLFILDLKEKGVCVILICFVCFDLIARSEIVLRSYPTLFRCWVSTLYQQDEKTGNTGGGICMRAQRISIFLTPFQSYFKLCHSFWSLISFSVQRKSSKEILLWMPLIRPSRLCEMLPTRDFHTVSQ